MKILSSIANESNPTSPYYLNEQIQAIELTYTFYSPALDIFISNLMVIKYFYFYILIIIHIIFK